VRTTIIILSIVSSTLMVSAGQATLDPALLARLTRLFPAASSFSEKQPSPPHFKAFADLPGGARKLVGVAFWTTEIEPLERGYDGPIKILVGLDPQGLLAGVIVADHREPYGSFSVDTPEFAAQFKGKDIRTPFSVGADIDAVTRATISVTSAARAIRNSARRVARQLLTPPTSENRP
jgi:NosR/NirI family nitrous oxide reductase transcriptional regulator